MTMLEIRPIRAWTPKRMLQVGVLCVGAAYLLSGCVYFNTFYNAEKAYEQALRMKKKRMAQNPEDTILVSSDEKLKLERSIAKSSKVLELHSDKPEYQPRALFLIGESYLQLGEYDKAIQKYDELARYYPNAEEIPLARFHRAKALFLDGQYSFAKPALEEIVASTQNPAWRNEAILCLAQLEAAENSPLASLELYEKLLMQKNQPAKTRAKIHFEAARLAFEVKLWERARKHAFAPEIRSLPNPLPLRADLLAAQCLYELKRYGDATEELRALLAIKRNRPYRPEIQLPLARALLAHGKAKEAVELWLSVAEASPKSAFSAEAFLLLGDHFLITERNEETAKVYFDSSAAAGDFPPHTVTARERSEALARLAELRKDTTGTAASPHYNDFMIAELFLFQLNNLDSALMRLDRIVENKDVDSVFGVRAAYARAFIHEEFKDSKARADSLYLYVLENYPGTEYAKQAEVNMGLAPTVRTDEDQAHELFLQAEKLRFDGEDPFTTAIPAYRRVVAAYPRTRAAARAQLNVAMLYESAASTGEQTSTHLDSAKAAYIDLRDRHPSTPYGSLARAKLQAAGIVSPPPAKTGSAPADSAASSADPKNPDDYGSSYDEYGEYGDGSESDSYEGSSEPEWQESPKEILEGGADDY